MLKITDAAIGKITSPSDHSALDTRPSSPQRRNQPWGVSPTRLLLNRSIIDGSISFATGPKCTMGARIQASGTCRRNIEFATEKTFCCRSPFSYLFSKIVVVEAGIFSTATPGNTESRSRSTATLVKTATRQHVHFVLCFHSAHTGFPPGPDGVRSRVAGPIAR